MPIHENPSPLAGKTVKIKADNPRYAGVDYRVEDWWDRVSGKSWMDSAGNPAAINYGFTSGIIRLPLDDEVLYGKIGPFGHLIHVSEIE